MGVNGLWDILQVISTQEKNSYLHDKKVAVDLSAWILAAKKTPYKSAESLVFDRASYLLKNNVHPVCVRDSEEPPELKKRALEKKGSSSDRSALYHTSEECAALLDAMGIPCLTAKGEGEALCALLCSNGIVDGVITEDGDALLYGAHTVYRNFKVTPPKPSPKKGNKETQSTSESDEIVFGAITEDVSPKKGKPSTSKPDEDPLKVTKMKKNSLGLDQSKLVAMALILGCQYADGIRAFGKEKVKQLLEDLEGTDLLQRLRRWKQCDKSGPTPGSSSTTTERPEHCTVCLHIGAAHEFEGCVICKSKTSCYKSDPQIPCSCNWCCPKGEMELKIIKAVMSMEDFPREDVIEEYMNYMDEVPEEIPDLKCPNLQKFQMITNEKFGWNESKSFKKCFALITAWQMHKLCKDPSTDMSSMLYEPVEIIGRHKVKGEQKLEVQWSEVMADDQGRQERGAEIGVACGEQKLEVQWSEGEGQEGKHLQTKENEEFFKKAYPQIANLFYESPKKSKAKPKGTSIAKGSKSTDTNKITDHFKQSKISNEQVSDKLTSNNSAKRNLEPEFNNTSPEKKMCLDRKREDL